MKKRMIVLAALAIQVGIMRADEPKTIYETGRDAILKAFSSSDIDSTLAGKVLVFNTSEKYAIKAGGITIAPGAMRWVPVLPTDLFPIRAMKSDDTIGESTTYIRQRTDAVVEVYVGHKAAFPKLTDKVTGKEVASKKSWTSGVSTGIKIWTRGLSKDQVQNGY